MSGSRMALKDAIDDNPWREGRAALIAIVAFFGGLGAWAATAPLDAGVVAAGEVKLAGSRVVVQHRDGGVISSHFVREGDDVVEGQILVELAAVELAAQERALAVQSIELEASRARLIAESAGRSSIARPAAWATLAPEYREIADAVLTRQSRELRARRSAVYAQTAVQSQRQLQLDARITGYHEQIASLDSQSALVQRELDGLRTLAAEGYAAESRVRAAERTAAELVGRRAELRGLIEQAREGVGEARLQSVVITEERSQQIAQELRVVDTQLAEVAPRLQSVREQLERSRVRASVGGRVVGLSVFNEGAVVQPGERILDIVPAERDLILSVRVRPMDADNVREGQIANVRLAAFEGRNMQTVRGAVERISADRLEDERTGQPYFEAVIRVPRAEIQRIAARSGRTDLDLSPGLPAEAVIPLRKRTALQYLIEPLEQSVWVSFRES
ncbi:MAG: HlyD family type I secretion periplasmic adaptor subunit [Alphaproteobacteria bacterium]|nr:HlyD family type I secretion periplasmic adaptor subunit [Alphaproteobacteria bacterium]